MPTYHVPDLSLDDPRVSPRALAYYGGRFQRALWEFIVAQFDRLSAERGFTQRQLAERVDKDAATINRCLAAPGNWRFSTFSELCVGMALDPRQALGPLAGTHVPLAHLADDHRTERMIFVMHAPKVFTDTDMFATTASLAGFFTSHNVAVRSTTTAPPIVFDSKFHESGKAATFH